MTTHPLDAAREMDKILDALDRAASYLTSSNEANAALHLSERVLYSPLTVILYQARGSAEQVRAYLRDHDAGLTHHLNGGDTDTGEHHPGIQKYDR